MANVNNNFFDDETNLTKIYGIDDFSGNSKQNLEDLVGYPINELDSIEQKNNNNLNNLNRTQNVQPLNNETVSQNFTNQPNNMTNPSQNFFQSVKPQRQEQTLPSSKNSQINSINTNDNLILNPSNTDFNTFLRNQIGKNICIQFLIGENMFMEKSGKLLAVNIDFLVIKPDYSEDLLICPLDDVKFIKLENISV